MHLAALCHHYASVQDRWKEKSKQTVGGKGEEINGAEYINL